MFEELLALGFTDAEYDAWLIRIDQGDQFGSGFVGVNPNSKIPALMDYSTKTPTRIFESGAILLYLAEKFNAFLPTDAPARTECLSWLFWQMGSAPIWAVDLGIFTPMPPIKWNIQSTGSRWKPSASLMFWTKRLGLVPFIAGSDYSIADMAIWAWYGQLVLGRQYNAGTFLDVDSYKNVKKWAELIDARPAVQRGRMVNKVSGDASLQLHERHNAIDFDTKTQDKIKNISVLLS